jgi:uncharacterized protein
MRGNLNPDRRAFLGTSGKLLGAHALGRFAAAGRAMALGPINNQSSIPIVDCHAHAGIAYLNGSANDLMDPWETIADPEGIIRRAAEAGIECTVIFPIECTDYAQANQDIAQICRRFPGRFIGFARHSTVTEQGSLRSVLLREYDELGLRGLKIIGLPPTREMLDVVKERSLPVLYHARRVSEFEELAHFYPTVNFIVAHLGSDESGDWREHLAAIELAKRFRNIHLDTSTVVLTEFLEKAIRELPAEQIIFGSDEPEVDCRMEIFKIRVLKLPTDKEALILGGNIIRLLGGHL